MARICFLLTTTPWTDFRQLSRQAPALAHDGHDVQYVAVNPEIERQGNLQFVRITKRDGKRARMTGALNLFRMVTRLKPEIIQLCSIEQLPLGLALKMFSRIKVVYDCREDMYHSMRDHKTRFPKWFRRILAMGVRTSESLAGRMFDGIVASDRAIYDSFKATPAQRKCIFYNTPLLSMFQRDYEPLAQRQFDLVVMGSMSPRTGVIDVIEALGRLKANGKQATLMLLGKPADDILGVIERRMGELQVAQQVHITGFIPHSDVPKTLATCRVGIVPLPDMPKFRNNIACKAFEYMACGMPVICTDLPPQRIFVAEGESGLFYPPADVEKLSDLISELLEDPQRAQRLGDHGMQLVEETWNGERDQEKLRHFYRTLLSDTLGPPLPISEPNNG